MTTITKAGIEQAGLAWLPGAGWRIAHGPDIAPDTPSAERAHYGQVILTQPLHTTTLIPRAGGSRYYQPGR